MLEEHQIVEALERLGALLAAEGVLGEVCLLGGTAMMLAFKARPATRDVDAIFEPTKVIRDMAAVVASEQGLPDDWLNDAAKGFASSRHDVTSTGLPQFAGLRLVAPVPEYMLALKCMASRIPGSGDDRSDVADITFLVRRLGLRSADEALAIVSRYYPPDRVPPRAQYLLEEIFDALDDAEGEP